MQTDDADTSYNGIGGIVGRSSKDSVYNNENYGTIAGNANVGGIVGNQIDDIVFNNVNLGAVKPFSGGISFNIGGIVGYQNSGKIFNNVNLGVIHAANIGVSEGTVTRIPNMGGIAGIMGTFAQMYNNYNLVELTYTIVVGDKTGGAITIGGIAGTVNRNAVADNNYYLSGAANNVFGINEAGTVAQNAAFNADQSLTAKVDQVKFNSLALALNAGTEYYKTKLSITQGIYPWVCVPTVGSYTGLNDGYPVFKKSYTIKFDATEGVLTTPSDATVVLNTGDRFVLPAATREGYFLAGWYTQASDGVKITDETLVKENITLYAQWTKCALGSITAKLNLGGKTVYSNQSLADLKQYLKVTGINNDGTVYGAISAEDCLLQSAKDITTLQPGDNEIRVAYTDAEQGITFETTCTVNVTKAQLIGLTVTEKEGIKKSYSAFEAFDQSGITVFAKYNYNTENEEITDYNVIYQKGS